MVGVQRSGQPGQPDYRLTVYPSVGRLLLVALGALMFVVMGVYLCFGDRSGPAVLGGVLSILFFGVCLLYVLWRLIVRRPAVVLDNTGLYDNASGVSAGHLAWNEISQIMVTFQDRYRRPTLSIQVTDPEALLARLPQVKRHVMQGNIKLNGAPVNIPQLLLPIKIHDLHREIQEVRQALDV